MTLLSLSCWAPEIAEPGEEAPADEAHHDHPASEAIGPGGVPLPTVSHATTPPDQFPSPPFTAWTVQSPLSIQGPNSSKPPLITVRRRGVRIEVLQILPDQERMLVRCDGCPAVDGVPIQGFLQTTKGVRVKGSPGDETDPLRSNPPAPGRLGQRAEPPRRGRSECHVCPRGPWLCAGGQFRHMVSPRRTGRAPLPQRRVVRAESDLATGISRRKLPHDTMSAS